MVKNSDMLARDERLKPGHMQFVKTRATHVRYPHFSLDDDNLSV